MFAAEVGLRAWRGGGVNLGWLHSLWGAGILRLRLSWGYSSVGRARRWQR
jgi:hypothetical protein